MQSNVVGWFELYVNDMARAKAFYQAVFERELQALPGVGSDDMQMLAFPMVDNAYGAPGALVKSAHMKPGTGGSLVYFSCEDCAVQGARVQASGGKVCQAKMSIGPYGFIVIAEDTEGNTIGLHSMR